MRSTEITDLTRSLIDFMTVVTRNGNIISGSTNVHMLKTIGPHASRSSPNLPVMKYLLLILIYINKSQVCKQRRINMNGAVTAEAILLNLKHY